MMRAWALLGSAVFLVLAPGTVAILVPWWISRWHRRPPFLGVEALPYIGGILIALGLYVLLDSFARFALQGIGTPAPILPTRHLVVSGLYRFVRNPMYLAALALIVGQGLLFGDPRLLVYGVAIWLAFHLFVRLYEEPTLQKTFGAEYRRFSDNVPRWIPRLTPWRPTDQ